MVVAQQFGLVLEGDSMDDLLNRPFIDPPEGITRHLGQKTGAYNAYFGLFYLTLALSTLVVWMRIYTKVRIVRQLVVEDYILISAWICLAFGNGIPVTLLCKLPFGAHVWNVTLRDSRDELLQLFILQTTYPPTIALLKSAILLQCLRIFCPPSSHHSATYWSFTILLHFNNLFWLVYEFLVLFGAHPIQSNWDPFVQQTSGLQDSFYVLNWTSGALNVGTDVLILGLCLRTIWTLRGLGSRRKLGVSAQFLGGLLASAAAIARLWATFKIFHNIDVTYWLAILNLCSWPELCFGFLIACLPVGPIFIGAMKRGTIAHKLGSVFRSRSTALSHNKQRKKSWSKSVEGRGGGERNASGANGASGRKGMGGIEVVTDIEFHELVVLQTQRDPSMISIEDLETGRLDWTSKDEGSGKALRQDERETHV